MTRVANCVLVLNSWESSQQINLETSYRIYKVCKCVGAGSSTLLFAFCTRLVSSPVFFFFYIPYKKIELQYSSKRIQRTS